MAWALYNGRKRLNTIPYILLGLRMSIYGNNLFQYGKIRENVQVFFEGSIILYLKQNCYNWNGKLRRKLDIQKDQKNFLMGKYIAFTGLDPSMIIDLVERTNIAFIRNLHFRKNWWLLKKGINILLFSILTQQAHDVRTTLHGRCYDVKTLKWRRYNVVLTSCACLELTFLPVSQH